MTISPVWRPQIYFVICAHSAIVHLTREVVVAFLSVAAASWPTVPFLWLDDGTFPNARRACWWEAWEAKRGTDFGSQPEISCTFGQRPSGLGRHRRKQLLRVSDQNRLACQYRYLLVECAENPRNCRPVRPEVCSRFPEEVQSPSPLKNLPHCHG